MDFTTVFNRGNKLTVAICVIIVLTGLATNLILGRLSAASDNIRIEQLRLAEFKAQLNTIPGLIVSLKSAPDRRTSLLKLNQELVALQATSLSERVNISQDTVDTFVQSARTQMKLIDSNQSDAAIQTRDNITNAAFVALSSSIQEKYEQFGGEASRFRQKGQFLKNMTFGVAGILILVTIVGFHRFSVADTQKEIARHAQELNGLRFAAVVQNSNDVILLTSRKGLVTLINDACQNAWGLSPKNCVGRHFLKLFHSSDSDDILKAIDQSLAKPNVDIETSIRVEASPGVHHHYQVHIRNLLNNVHIGGLLLTFHDITEQAAVKEALTHQATHDRLTGLPNRSQVIVKLDEALASAKATGRRAGALFIDLDNFKTINDTLGHEMGDLLLMKVAKRIQNTIRPTDMAARLGGDEFVVLLENAGGSDGGEIIAKRIADQFARPFHLGDQDIFTSASIGVAVSQDSDMEPNDLLRRADTAMYEAKKHGKSGYVIFDPSMKMQPERVQDIGSEVQSAVQEKSFEIFFQPIVTIDGLEIKEFEVQVRWQHPTLGRISSQKLEILLGEQGLLDSVREWSFSESCRQLSDWSKSYIGPDEVKMSVNISRQQMIDPDLCTNILGSVTEIGIRPRQITIEVSESEVLADLDRTRSVFRTIKSQGFRIAIDNFGTGQSSMDYLNDLPLDTLKIDRNIIDQIGEDESADRILKSIIDAAHRLKLSVVADGVETSEQCRVLKEFKCDLGQGSALANSLTTQELGICLGHPESNGIGKVL